MVSNHKQITLGDLISLQRGTTYQSSLLGRPGPVLLGLASIQRDGGFRDDSLKTYGGQSPEKLILKPGDVYVSLKDVTQSGDLLGAVSRVPMYVHEGRLTQDTVKLVFKNNAVPREFVYWLLRTPQYRRYCRAHAIGTTNLSLSREDFLNFSFLKPSSAQFSLTTALDAIDNKIELNRRMNQTLEQMAQGLFKSWFVDFAPVHANRNGERLAGLAPEAQALFPSEFEESELGLVPRGWRVNSLDNIADFLNGLALQKFPPVGDEYLPVIKIAELRRGVTESSGKASPTIPNKYIIDDGDVLFSWSGSLEVVIWCGGRGALNQHLFKVTSANYPKWFYYLWTKAHLSDFQAVAASKATTMGHIQRHHLTAAKVLVPPPDLVSSMTSILEPLLERIVANNLETRTLSTMRDVLLPTLLSGEVRVRDAEHIVEELM